MIYPVCCTEQRPTCATLGGRGLGGVPRRQALDTAGARGARGGRRTRDCANEYSMLKQVHAHGCCVDSRIRRADGARAARRCEAAAGRASLPLLGWGAAWGGPKAQRAEGRRLASKTCRASSEHTVACDVTPAGGASEPTEAELVSASPSRPHRGARALRLSRVRILRPGEPYPSHRGSG